jgi:multiple sugar transport system substrate-binding protein
VSSNVLLPLNSYVNSSVISNEFPSALDQMEINGTYYGLPAQVTDTLIYYNMTLFREAGLPVPWQPTNWSDIITAAETIHSMANMSSVIPMNVYEGVKADEASSFTGFEGLLYGTGWGLYNFTASKWYGENPGLLQTLQFYQQVFVNKSLASASLSAVPYVTVGQYLQQGKLAIAIDGSWMYGYQWGPGAQHPITDFPSYIGVAKIPTEFGQSPGFSTMVGGWGWAAYKHTSDPALAVSLIEALANTTNSIEINLPGSALAGGLPTTKDAVNNPLFSKLMPTDPSLDTFYTNLLQYGNYRPPIAGYPKVSYQLDVAMSSVVHGTASPSGALSAYDSALVSTFGSSNVQTISPTSGVVLAQNSLYSPLAVQGSAAGQYITVVQSYGSVTQLAESMPATQRTMA